MAIASEIGGADRLSESSRVLLRQAASQTLQVERLSARIVNGDDTVDLEQLSRMQNSLSRTLASLHRRRADARAASFAAPVPEPDLDVSQRELDALYAFHADPRGLGTVAGDQSGRVVAETAEKPPTSFPEASDGSPGGEA